MFAHLRRAWLVGVTFVLAGMCSSAWGQSGSTPPPIRRIIVGGDHDYFPYEFLDENGKPAGFNIDLMDAVGQAMGLEVEHRLGPWEESLQAFKEGRIDVLPMFLAEERTQFADFSDPFTILYHVVFIRHGSPGFTRIEDLAGKEVVVRRDAFPHDYLRAKCPDATLVPVETEPDAIRLLASGKHHCALLTRVGGSSAIRRLDLRNVTSGSPPLLSRDYCLGVRKGNTALLERLNRGLKIVQATGEYDEVREKWLGQECAGHRVLEYLLPALAVVGGILIAVSVWTWALRRQVAKRTQELREELVKRTKAERELLRVNRALGVLSQCNRSLIQATEEPRLLGEVCRIIVESGGYRLAWIGFAEHDEEKTVRPVAHAGFDEGYLAAARITWADTERGQGPTGTVIRTGEPYVCKDIQTDPRYAPWRDLAGKHGCASSVALPIVAREQTLGALTVYAAEADAFDEEEARLLWELADDIAFGIVGLRTRAERDEARTERDRLFNLSIDMLCVAGFDGFLKQVNPAWAKTLGWTDEELLGKPSLEFVHPDDREATKAAGEQLLSGEAVCSFENRYRCKDSSYRWFSWSSFPLPDQELIFAVTRDVTEHKRADELLRQSEERYRRITEAITDYIYTVRVEDGKSLETVHGPACERVTGYTSEELRSAPMLWFDMILAEDRGLVDEMNRRILSNDNPQPVEHRIRRKDGAIRWIGNTPVPKYDSQGNLLSFDGVIRDITERRQAEEALHEAARAWQTTFDAVNDAVWLMDRDRRIVRCNTATEHLFHRPCDEIVGRHCCEIVHGTSQPLPGCPTLRMKQSRHRETMEMPIGERWFHVAVDPVFDAKGEITGTVHIVSDITERKQAENALKATQQQIEMILGAAKTGLDIIDSDFNIRYIDPEWQKVYGNPSGRKCYEYFMDGTDPCPGCGILEAMATKARVISEEVLPKEGNRPIQVTTIPFQTDDGEWLFAEVNIDITDRKQAAQEILKQSQALEQIPSMVMITDTEGVVEYVNPKFTQVTGFAREEVVGKNARELGEQSPQDTEKMWNAIQSGRDWRGEFRNKRKDGGFYWERASISSVRDAGGTITHFVKVAEDISEQKRIEEERTKLQAQLIQAQKMEAVGTLAGGVAHDFNNMLTTILGFTEMALSSVGETDSLFADLKRVLDAGQRAAGLVRQLLLFSRNQPVELRPMDLNHTVTDLLKMLTRLIGEDIVVETRLVPDAWTVEADPGALEQVVMNLAVNARDAMPQGGQITVSTENVEINQAQAERMAEGRAGRFVCLSVADTGTGMDRETVERIFEPFFTTKGAGKGTGLGLSVVYGIVKQHGGWITVDSTPGQGAEFKVYLPAIAEKAEEETEEKATLEDLKGNAERILLVEDDPDVREFAAKVLTQGGYVVLEADCVQNALEVFEKEGGRFDLVVSDCVLPDGSGLRLAEQLTLRRPELRVALGSGYTDDRSQWAIIRERGFVFVQKPYGMLSLLQAVREAIDSGK